jgi:hypothetical protein
MIKIGSALVMSGLLTACAATTPPAQHLRFAEAAAGRGRIDWTRPLVLEFEAGDRLPVHVEFSDQLFALSPSPPVIELVAKRHGFVRIEGRHITSSFTGDDFDARPLAPGAFRLGLATTRQGSWVELAVTTPRKREPAP